MLTISKSATTSLTAACFGDTRPQRQGVVLSDHARSLDWRARRAEFISIAPAEVLEDVTAKVQALIGGED
jgi:mRNA-degrading endonuclease toxin of MazEF toxin-antitoxin module